MDRVDAPGLDFTLPLSLSLAKDKRTNFKPITMWRPLVTALSFLGMYMAMCRAEEGGRLRLKPLQLDSRSESRNDLGQQYSGYFRLNRTYSAEMFFFMFERRAEAASAPVVIWMTGGPGCSSELAVRCHEGLSTTMVVSCASHSPCLIMWSGVLRKRAVESPPRRSGRHRSRRDQVRLGRGCNDDLRRPAREHWIFVQ